MHYEQFQNGTVKCIEDEIPFEVPEGWAWARLASLIELFITGPFGSALHKSDYVVDGIPLINPKNIIDGKIIPITKMQVSPETVERLSSFKVAPNDIVIARRGNMGRCAVVQPDQEGWLCGTGSFVLRLPAVLCSDYFAACLRSPYSVELMSGNSIGNTMLNLNQTILKRILIPVPPCTEQNRIINAIFDADTLLAEIADQSESLVMCVAKTKFKILDLAIRGKLVPQDPNDEPASVLLEHIRAEKEKLIKQGKIKRDKKGSVIFKGEDNSYYEKISDSVTCIDDELPFEIPNNWCWARLSSISVNYDNYRKPINATERKKRIADKEKDKLYPYFGATGQVGFIDDFLFNGEYILLGEDAAPFLDKTAQKAYMVSGKIWVNNHVHILESLILSEYLLHSLNSVDYLNYVYGTTRLKLTQENMNKILLPIPPIKEQTKLCQVISNANSFIKSIEASLN